MVLAIKRSRPAAQAQGARTSTLEQLLALIGQGGACTSAVLGRQLGVSSLLVEMMLLDLEAKGYITRCQSCGSACTGCEPAGRCEASQNTPLMWMARPGRR
jgi:hypothetical protein